ncbi:D-amino-acid transaminase [Suttonella ornithocola]|uniref:Aminodeoxychorismate lyase n=1 Tax=Suttonella ornithocola TaxID=279832 RepID=A0A380MXZ3_9GAMM|nr:D-amino-acid transaminase [Suttonella ornithocola]SUO97429.1 D-alanine aminotransferase [Suttonella ornithocola]
MNTHIVYVNGEFLPAKEASVSIYDRGFLMADSVYEVSAVVKGKLIDNSAHLKRLERSLGELNMPMPWSFSELSNIQRQIIEKNHITNGEIYLQVTRGTGVRDFLIDTNMRPTLIMFPIFHDPLAAQNEPGLKIQTLPDIRWQRRDIKTTQLLAQSLCRSIAHHNGYDDAWMVDEHGYITEGTANNAYIVKGDSVFTRPANHEILNGITRQAMIKIINQLGLRLVEKAFTPREAILANEAFITSAANWATPVLSIDNHIIGDGKAGKVTLALRDNYLSALEELSE